MQVVTTTTTITTEEKYRVLAPESMQETFMSDSEDEGGEYNQLPNVSSRIRNSRLLLTVFRIRICIELALLDPDP
jgi:hypothetical protein